MKQMKVGHILSGISGIVFAYNITDKINKIVPGVLIFEIEEEQYPV